MLNFTKLNAPTGDGDILIEPPPAQWSQLIEYNLSQSRERNSKIMLAGIPAADLRAQIRQSDQPILACGHQPAFIHAGVWAKQVAVRCFSDRLDIQAFDLVVDQDAPRSSGLLVPVVHPDDLITTKPIAFSEAPAGSAYEGRPILTKHDIALIEAELAPVLSDSSMALYLKGLSPAQDSVDQHLAGRHQVDAALQADLPTIPVSRAFGGHFLVDLLLNADRFFGAYNDSLAAYRKRENVKEPDRPLPNLQRNGQRIETALWIYQPLNHRRRLWIEPGNDQLQLYANDTAIGTIDPKRLIRDPNTTLAELHPWVIRPRALTLTLWARLLACDLFVHGIGGAKYDRITDDIFRRYYGCEPPAMACVTATLRLPLPRHTVSEADIRRAERECRDVQFNPQHYLSKPPPALLAERERLLAESNRLRDENGDSVLRRDVFRALHEVKTRLFHSEPNLEQQMTHRLEHARRQLNSNQIADSREFFYALQPPNRLEMLTAKIRQSF